MDERHDISVPPEDELWDPDLHRRAFRALSMSERLEVMVVIVKEQSSLYDRIVVSS